MKRVILATLLSFAAVQANATVLDFDSGVPAGLTLGGNMTWNSTGGGHLYMENYDTDDHIVFSAPTTVNSFQMNREPWQDYVTGTVDDWLVRIEAFDATAVSLWSTTLDLAAYANWSDWLTVNLDIDNVSTLTFYATGGNTPTGSWDNGFWPSIDNLTINEPHGNVPEPASLALLGVGLAGLAALRRRKIY